MTKQKLYHLLRQTDENGVRVIVMSKNLGDLSHTLATIREDGGASFHGRSLLKKDFEIVTLISDNFELFYDNLP